MKTIGFIGGLTGLSSMDYYRLFNQLTNEKPRGVHSAKLLIYSVDFEEIKQLTCRDDWNGVTNIMISAAQILKRDGAGCVVIGANTMHYIPRKVQAAIGIPLIHIATAAAATVSVEQIDNVALLGTKYTIQPDFYQNELAAKNISMIVPGSADREYISDASYNKMSRGIFCRSQNRDLLRSFITWESWEQVAY